jgi:hypothetical protein
VAKCVTVAEDVIGGSMTLGFFIDNLWWILIVYTMIGAAFAGILIARIERDTGPEITGAVFSMIFWPFVFPGWVLYVFVRGLTRKD